MNTPLLELLEELETRYPASKHKSLNAFEEKEYQTSDETSHKKLNQHPNKLK